MVGPLACLQDVFEIRPSCFTQQPLQESDGGRFEFLMQKTVQHWVQGAVCIHGHLRAHGNQWHVGGRLEIGPFNKVYEADDVHGEVAQHEGKEDGQEHDERLLAAVVLLPIP